MFPLDAITVMSCSVGCDAAIINGIKGSMGAHMFEPYQTDLLCRFHASRRCIE